MRISDWSSDVCSSDLREHEEDARHDRDREVPQHLRLPLGAAENEAGDTNRKLLEGCELLDFLHRLARHKARREVRATHELPGLDGAIVLGRGDRKGGGGGKGGAGRGRPGGGGTIK